MPLSIPRLASGKRTMRNVVLVLGIVTALLGGAVLTQLFGSGARRGPVQQLARHQPKRAFAPRLSIRTKYHDCTPIAAQPEKPADRGEPGDIVPREACGGGGEGPLSVRTLSAARKSSSPDSLQAFALTTVIWWDDKEASLDAAISALQKALRLSPGSVPLMVDLSAAHLVRAERAQNPRDLIEAINYAGNALALEPENASARFNSALALQAFGFVEEADRAWNAYLTIDSTSSWAGEARDRQRDLVTPAAALRVPGTGAPDSVVAAFARSDPQEARELGWDRVLGEWGKAVEEGDSARAAAQLGLAERLGHALEQRPKGDASLMDAVSVIRAAHSDAIATLALARAHQGFAAGRAHFSALRYDSAHQAFTRVAEMNPPSPVLMQWAALFQAGTAKAEGRTMLVRLLPQVDTAHRVLEGRVRMMLGTLLLRQREYLKAREQHSAAEERFRHAGETEMMGAALSSAGEAAYEQGDTVGAYRMMHRATRVLRPHRDSQRLHNHLMALGKRAILDEMPRAAVSIYDESIPVAERVAARAGSRINVLEALQYRSHARATVGDSLGAARDLESAVAVFGQLPSQGAQAEWARAVLWMSSRGTVSEAAIDSAVSVFANNFLWLVPALFWRAEARLAAGNLSSAARGLDSVTLSIQGLSSKESDVRLRGAIIEQARSRFDQLVMLHLRTDSIVDALRALERGRVSFAPGRDNTPSPHVIRLAPPPGQTAMEYALIGDTLLAWIIRPDSIHFMRTRLDRDAFLLAVEQTGAALESGAPGADAGRGLRRLYDWLIRPVRDRLGPPETPLVILADGELAGIPFAALLDRERDRYLVEDHPLRYAATLADAARPPPTGPAPAGPALLVANPAFERGEYPTLYRLPGALGEVDSLQGLYSPRVLLRDSGATREAFMAQAQAARIIHYAGHAVFNDAQPERSFLVLAGAGPTGRLTAESLGAMELRGSPLVVLSACHTLRAHQGRSGGFAGFSGALLAAGARGVVGSLWQANDELTRPLMLAFHGEYRKLGDPARALREAQLQMLRSPDPAQRSPAAWAGFRYAGS